MQSGSLHRRLFILGDTGATSNDEAISPRIDVRYSLILFRWLNKSKIGLFGRDNAHSLISFGFFAVYSAVYSLGNEPFNLKRCFSKIILLPPNGERAIRGGKRRLNFSCDLVPARVCANWISSLEGEQIRNSPKIME